MAVVSATPNPRIPHIVQSVGADKLNEYISETFPAPLRALNYYTIENAPTWLDLDAFMAWISRSFQSPLKRAPMAIDDMPTPPPKSSTSRTSISKATTRITPSNVKNHTADHSTKLSALPLPLAALSINLSDDSDVEIVGPPTLAANKRKRNNNLVKHEAAVVDLVDTSDSDIDVKVSIKPAKKIKAAKQSQFGPSKPAKRQKRSVDASDDDQPDDHIKITRQLTCKKLITLTSIPSCWSVPQPGEDVVYLLDLSDDHREWKDTSGNLLSMAAIIKSQDQDSWGGGSAGSLSMKKTPAVVALDGQLCQYAEHHCQGVYHCTELDMGLLDGCERYEPDDEEMCELFEAERDVNLKETASVELRAAAFYNEAHNEPCPAIINEATGARCDGLPVYRDLTKMNYDGKKHFIGCSRFMHGDAKSHRFMSIPRDVQEPLLLQLFQSDGEMHAVDTGPCARVISCRSGAKGNALCPYTHVRDGKAVQGRLTRRECKTKIKIYSPTDRMDRRAIVILDGAHNHPKPPATKLSRKGKDLYQKAAITAGVTALTVVKCDSAASTQRIFGGKIPASSDPALANPRVRRKLIRDLRVADNPHGLGLEGVLYHQRAVQSKIPREKWYIHEIISRDGVDIIITMLPFLADRFHDADASLHDNTYKRLSENWKEWEVVIWDRKLNTRITFARIYCIPAEVMDRVRLFRFLETKAEVDEFVEFCEGSEHKKLRDWMADKRSSPWFIPSLNQYMSKIPRDDWHLTPGDTNINESAHPHTNMHTGINLPILEAIKKAYELDLSVEARLQQAEKDCILNNHRNTKPERDHANRKRQESRTRLANARIDAEDTLDNLEDEIQAASQAQKAAQLRTKELREKKKALKAASGVKQKPTGKGSRGKVRFGPGAADVVDENTTPINDPSAGSENIWDPQPPSPTFGGVVSPSHSPFTAQGKPPPKACGKYSFNFPDTPTAGVRTRGNYKLGLPDALRLFPTPAPQPTQTHECELDPSLEPDNLNMFDGPCDVDILDSIYF